jgi:hypothetical protein
VIYDVEGIDPAKIRVSDRDLKPSKVSVGARI